MRRITKKQWEDFFVKTAWIMEVWDKSNKTARRYNKIAMRNLDIRWCVRAKHQVADLDLRKRFLNAKYDGTKTPRLVPAVRRHIEAEFNKTYPKGVANRE
jgi:hypothetical protein